MGQAEQTQYDSRVDTFTHIARVRELMLRAIEQLLRRAHEHDQSKLREPELSVFNEFTPRLAEVEYDSDEYKAALEGMGDGLQHHYKVNRHHPEYFEQGIGEMNLLDLLELLCDWKAAGERHGDGGNLLRSIDQNMDRFGYGEELRQLLRNTALDLHMT